MNGCSQLKISDYASIRPIAKKLIENGCPEWFLVIVLEKLKEKYPNKFRFGGSIRRKSLYSLFAGLYKYNRQRSRKIMKVLAKKYPGIILHCQGFRIEPNGERK